MPKIQHRTATIARANQAGDERIIAARLVPYNQPTEILPGWREQFAPNSVRADELPPILFRDHEKPIGAITALENRDDGCYIEAKISQTPLGDETWQLVKDNVLTRMSIGFIPVAEEKDGEDEQLHTITDAIILEASIVPFPAYPQAEITTHRNKQKEETTMSTENQFMTREAGDELAAKLAEQSRKLETLAADTSQPASHSLADVRSFGDYAKLYVAGDKHIRAAFDGITSQATKDVDQPQWLGLIRAEMAAKQPILNAFTHEMNLPATGLAFSYGRLNSSTFKVDKQVNEGDPLVHSGQLAFSADTVNVETFGGYSTVSRQRIEREADVTVLSDIFRGQAKAYALNVEQRMRQMVLAAVTAAEANPTIKTAPATAADWLAVVLDLADAYEDSIFPLDGLLVSPAVFLELTKLPEERKALQIAGAPDNKAGTVTVSVPEANLYGLKVIRLPGWEGNHATGYAASAAVCKESAGAPLRLSDEDVTALTTAFSVYGYAAFYVPAPDAFKAIKLA